MLQAPADLGAYAALIWAWALEFVPRLGAALFIAVVGYFVARSAARVSARIIQGALGIDPTLVPSIAAVIRYAILIFVFIATLSQLGIQTASVLAALGAAGLAIGLALQGTLSNIAAGLMLLWLRPFRVGDYVETAAVSGSIREIGLFATELETFDGIFRFVPNSQIWNVPLTNYSRCHWRLMNLTIGIRLEDDADEAEALITTVLREEKAVQGSPPAEVFIDTMADGFTYIAVRAWLPGGSYWPLHRSLSARMRAALNGAGIPVQRLLHAAADTGPSANRTPLAERRGLLHWPLHRAQERPTQQRPLG